MQGITGAAGLSTRRKVPYSALDRNGKSALKEAVP
jgi:hypothetical protein